MASYNKVVLIGNVTRDVEVRHTQGGTAIGKIGLAVNRKIPGRDGKEDREETCFVDLTAWGKTAEVMGQYLKKGDPVFVEGRLVLEKWKTNEGEERSKLSVTVENFQFLAQRKKEEKRQEPEEQVDYGDIPF